MNYNRGRLNTAAMAALLATGIAAFGAFGQKAEALRKYQPHADGAMEDVRVDTASTRLITLVHACTTMADLKKRMPEIADLLEKMAKERNVDGLMQAYDALGSKVRDIQIATASRHNLYCEDELAAISRQIDSASPGREQLGWVFLALPRLFNRASQMLFPDNNNELEKEGELLFLRAVGRSMPAARDSVTKYWYKNNGMPPTETEMEAFFSSFISLF